jgi:NADH pyrophosphatase NudC (nudix superfamily)
MTEYIDRDAFIAEKRMHYCAACKRRQGMKNGKIQFCYEIGDAPCRACDVADMLDYIEDFPAADVRPVVHARWEIKSWWSHKNCYSMSECSACGKWVKPKEAHEFCPWCGAMMDADMREVDDET